MAEKIASLYAEIGAKVDNFVAGMRTVKGELVSTKQAHGNLLADLGNFLQVATPYIGAATAIGVALHSAAEETLQYADEVRKLSILGGTSTEEASRFIEVLDHYGISSQNATTATRILTKQGLAPTMETLAKLSDQYLSINSVEEKNAFILKNLGRGGAAWAEILTKGSSSLREQSAAINQNLVLSQKQVDAARSNELANKELDDSWKGIKITLGNAILPLLTNVTDGINMMTQAVSLAHADGKEWLHLTIDQRNAYLDLAATDIAATRQLMLHTGAITENTDVLLDNSKAIQQVTDDNQNYLATLGDRTASDLQYANDLQDLADKIDQAEMDILKAKKQGYSATGQHMTELKGKLADLQGQYKDLQDAQDLQTKSALLGMLQQQLAADGLDADETKALVDLGVQWGVYSQTAIDEMNAAQDQIAIYAGRISGIPDTVTTHFLTIFSSVQTGQPPPGGWGSGGHDKPRTGVAAGGRPRAGEWTLVGDMPGGGIGPYTEIIDPTGYVHSAAETRSLIRMGLPYKTRAGGGYIGQTDDPYAGANLSPAQLSYNQSYYGTGSSGGGGGGGGHGGQQAAASGVKAVAHATQTAADAAQKSAGASAVTAEALQQQITAAAQQSAAITTEIKALRRDLQRSLRDAVQTLV